MYSFPGPDRQRRVAERFELQFSTSQYIEPFFLSNAYFQKLNLVVQKQQTPQIECLSSLLRAPETNNSGFEEQSKFQEGVTIPGV
jgi:hypothetical protein